MAQRVKKFGNNANNQIFVKLDTDVLEKIQKALEKKYVAQIGILGSKTYRLEKRTSESEAEYRKRAQQHKKAVSANSGLTNADIGLIHEKGSVARNIPRRSFLEMSLTTKLPSLISRIGKDLLQGVNELNIQNVYQKLARICEGVVLQAFNTTGFGKWAPNSPGTIARKKSSRPLIDTAQLRQSISSRVVSV